MYFRNLIVTVLVSAVAVGCGPDRVKRACMGGSDTSSLFADAVLVRLDVYGAGGHCGGDGLLASGSGAPLVSRSYAQGQAITLDVPPGPHALVLTTYADEAGTMVMGQACTESDLAAGSQICFDLTLIAVEGNDLAIGTACTVDPDSCGKGSYCDGTICQPGCSSDSTCRADSDGGISSTPLCEPTMHKCVECLTAADCTIGQHATGSCVAGKCVATCASGFSNCNGAVGDGCECKTDPAAPACCGSGCQTQHNNGWGGVYYDCHALGQQGVTPTTYTSAMANLAAFSDTAQDGAPGGRNFGSGSDIMYGICKPSSTNSTCTCWIYDAIGTYVDRIGHTYHSSGIGPDKGCLQVWASDPTWN